MIFYFFSSNRKKRSLPAGIVEILSSPCGAGFGKSRSRNRVCWPGQIFTPGFSMPPAQLWALNTPLNGGDGCPRTECTAAALIALAQGHFWGAELEGVGGFHLASLGLRASELGPPLPPQANNNSKSIILKLVSAVAVSRELWKGRRPWVPVVW